MRNSNSKKGFLYRWLIISSLIVLVVIVIFVFINKNRKEDSNVFQEISSIYETQSQIVSSESSNKKNNEKINAITSLDDWDKLNYENKISENCYNFFYNLLSGKSEIDEYNSVVINDYKISYATSHSDSICYLNFDFIVESSSLESLPPGKYHKVVKDIVDIYMDDDIDDAGKDFLGEFKGIEEVEMVNNWITSFFVWDCPKFGESKESNVNYLVHQYGKNGELLFDDFIRLSKEKLGVEIDESEYEGYLTEKNGAKYIQEGGIGGSCAYKIKDYQVNDDIATVTVQFYAECNCLLPSHLVAYHIKKDGIWLGYDLLKESKYPPYGLQQFYS